MHSLPMPEIATEKLYKDSYSKVRIKELKQRYEDEIPQILSSAQRFILAAERGRIEILDARDFQPESVSVEEMSKLYTSRVLRKEGPGRPHYDKLMAAVPHERCPYCGERRIKSIDHYLPKETFSSLSVTPANLVPSCSDCNHAKLRYYPAGKDPALLHPYFDNVEHVRWLHARILPANLPIVKFEVRVDNDVDGVITSRLEKHLQIFKLDGLFESHAGQTIEELNSRFFPTFHSIGAVGLRDFLREEAEFRSGGKNNTWQRALFDGLADSDWYCSEYFV